MRILSLYPEIWRYKIERFFRLLPVCYWKHLVIKKEPGHWLKLKARTFARKWKPHTDWFISEKGMFVGLKQPRGDEERCVTRRRLGIKEKNGALKAYILRKSPRLEYGTVYVPIHNMPTRRYVMYVPYLSSSDLPPNLAFKSSSFLLDTRLG